jgi:hypothetical protein
MKVMNSASEPGYRQIRAVALPSEHGSWGFLLEPLVLGLLAAGSSSGLLLAAAMLFAFLIHQPLKIALKDRLKGRRAPRTVQAERFAVAYSVLALLLLSMVALTSGLTFAVPLLAALPFLLVQIRYDARNQSRALIPEVCGALALGSTASAIALLDGWTLWEALPLWMIVASRNSPSILYVRARLKLEHGKPVSAYPTWLAHSAALLLVTGMAATRIIPTAVVGAFVLLLVRALFGLSSRRKPRPAKQIGLLEIVYGLIVVVFAVIGYLLHS